MELEMKNLDFISELPDTLLHHILPFIDMIFVVQTSILSKRWRYIWKSLHFLNFNEEVFNTTHFITSKSEPKSENPLDKEKDDPFMDFVNQVLSIHCKSQINAFSLSGFDPRALNQTGLSRSKYDPWLTIRRNAEEYESRKTLDLPLCFFNSNTLTTLKLNMGSKRGRQIFKVPDSLVGTTVGLPCLKTLHLGSVFLVDGDSISGFFSRCFNVETLIISNCLLEKGNNLSIFGYQLKNLELGISCVENTCIGENKGKITVFAPKLESFKGRDLLLSEFYFSLQDASALLEADLDYCMASSPDCLCQISLDYSPMREMEYIQNVFECLRNVCNVNSLSLYMGLFMGTLQDYSSFQGLVNPFCNLRFLQLKTLFFKEHILNIAVLEMCPNLQTLILERTSGPVSRPLDKIYSKDANKVDEHWEVNAPLHCLPHNLQFIEIRGVYGTLDELKLLRFLMKNSMMLVKLILVTSVVCRSEPYFKGCLQTFLRKFGALPKASSSVETSVVPYHRECRHE